MNIDVKILNKILANQLNIKKESYTMTKWDSSQVHKEGSTYTWIHQCNTNRRRPQNHMIIARNEERASDRIQHPFMIKLSPKWVSRK